MPELVHLLNLVEGVKNNTAEIFKFGDKEIWLTFKIFYKKIIFRDVYHCEELAAMLKKIISDLLRAEKVKLPDSYKIFFEKYKKMLTEYIIPENWFKL